MSTFAPLQRSAATIPAAATAEGSPRRTLLGFVGTRRVGAIIFTVILGVGGGLLLSNANPASAATVSFSQCNNRGAGPGGAALSVRCSISIVNTIDANGGTSSVLYLRICTLNGCTGDAPSSSDVINAVHQCNGSDTAGGSTMVCSVDIINNITASAPGAPTALTLNQCIGSGTGGGTLMTACIPSSNGSATVTQCNGSGTGGGGTMTCTASGTTSAAFPVTVDQCNGSETGGGSFVTCTTTITTNVFDPPVLPVDPPLPPTPLPMPPVAGPVPPVLPVNAPLPPVSLSLGDPGGVSAPGSSVRAGAVADVLRGPLVGLGTPGTWLQGNGLGGEVASGSAAGVFRRLSTVAVAGSGTECLAAAASGAGTPTGCLDSAGPAGDVAVGGVSVNRVEGFLAQTGLGILASVAAGVALLAFGALLVRKRRRLV